MKDTLVVSRGVGRPLDKAITQGTVLSFVSSVFDSVGLIVANTVRACLLLKDIWKISGQSWDDELSEDIRYGFPSLRAIDYCPLLLHRTCGSN